MARHNAHSLYGSTDQSSCVPDASVYSESMPGIQKNPALSDPLQKCNPESLKSISDAYLADVLAVRECFENKPMDPAPLLLRFDNYDLVASADAQCGLSLWIGAVDTSKSLTANTGDPLFSCAPNEGLCLAWAPYETLSEAIGQQAASIDVDGNDAVTIGMEACIIRIRTERGSVLASLEER